MIDWKVYAREKGTLIKTYEKQNKQSFCIRESHLRNFPEGPIGQKEKDEQISFWLSSALLENREFSIKLDGLNLQKGKTKEDLELFLIQYLKWRGTSQ